MAKCSSGNLNQMTKQLLLEHFPDSPDVFKKLEFPRSAKTHFKQVRLLQANPLLL